MKNLTIIEFKLSLIKLPNASLKSHPDYQIEKIAKSIEQYGFNDPVAIDEENEIIEGVGRVLAAKKLKLKSIPVIQLNHLSEVEKRSYRIAHNKLCLDTGFDLDLLKDEFNELLNMSNAHDYMTGFEQVELDDMLALPSIDDMAPELTESLKTPDVVACPHCGGDVYV